MELREILEIENYIKEVILDNTNKKEYFTTKDFINLFKKDNVNKYIYFKQSVNNVLSNLYKQDLIYRIKKGVYSFSDDFLKLRLSIENKENSEYIFNDIYHRYLLEKTTAVPNLNNIYIYIYLKKYLVDIVSKQYPYFLIFIKTLEGLVLMLKIKIRDYYLNYFYILSY